MKKAHFVLFIVVQAWNAQAQTTENFNLELLAQYTFSQELSDIWGYVDENGNEYAIVGRNAGVSIINVTDPSNLYSVGEFTGNSTVWRDIKTWNDHAYITCDACGNGLLIIDLSPLPQSTSLPYTYWVGDTFQFQSAHNIYIDENGFAYIFGANHSAGGAIILDLNADPMVPLEVGKYDENYLHDGVVRGDTLWGASVYIGDAQVIDVSNKENPILISSWKTPNAFTHNIWFSDDNNYVFTTDEVENGSIGAYDVSNVLNPTEIDVWKPVEEYIIPHNTHYFDEFLVTSHYTIGVSILDVRRPDNMLEVARYDTSPDYHLEGFHGAWGAYPWLPSGRLIVSDIEEGLYIFQPAYMRGCYLQGTVSDEHTGAMIFFPTIEIIEDSLVTEGSIIGEYFVSTLNAGTYSVKVSAAGYYDKVIEGVELVNGELTILDVGLSNWPAGISEHRPEVQVGIFPNPASDNVEVRASSAINSLKLMDMNARTLVHDVVSAAGTYAYTLSLSHLAPGMYLLEVNTAEGNIIKRVAVL